MKSRFVEENRWAGTYSRRLLDSIVKELLVLEFLCFSDPDCIVFRLPLIGVLLLSSAGGRQAQAAKPIEVHVPAHDCAAPCDMEVTVSIPRHPDNRSASVVWSYDDSKDWTLGPGTDQVEFAVSVGKFDKGAHAIYAVLVREKDGKRETFEDVQRISVR
jgi:hypothetical protein